MADEVDDKTDLFLIKTLKRFWYIYGMLVIGGVAATLFYIKINTLEKEHDPEQVVAATYYKKTDSLVAVLFWTKKRISDDENQIKALKDSIIADEGTINRLYIYKMPYGRFGIIEGH